MRIPAGRFLRWSGVEMGPRAEGLSIPESRFIKQPALAIEVLPSLPKGLGRRGETISEEGPGRREPQAGLRSILLLLDGDLVFCYNTASLDASTTYHSLGSRMGHIRRRTTGRQDRERDPIVLDRSPRSSLSMRLSREHAPVKQRVGVANAEG